MDRFSPELLAFSVLSLVLATALAAMLGTWVWALGRVWKGLPILAGRPGNRLRPASWGSLTIFAVVLLYLGVNLSVAKVYYTATHRRPARAAQQAKPPDHGPREPAKASERDRADDRSAPEAEASRDVRPEKAAGAEPGKNASGEQTLAEMMLQFAISNALLLVLVPMCVRFSSGAGLLELGLDLRGWQLQVQEGLTAALLMTPLVCAIQLAAIRIWTPQSHPVEQMVLDGLTLPVALLAVVSTMVLAPLIEELLFRGMFQRWVARWLPEPSPAGTSTLANDASAGGDGDSRELREVSLGDPPASAQSDPVAPGQPPPRASSRTLFLPILLTSLIFAGMHLPQWPAPIAIFPLSVALGLLFERTGSLLAVVTMHSAFNGLNTLLLLLAALAHRLHPQLGGLAGGVTGSSSLTDWLALIGFR